MRSRATRGTGGNADYLFEREEAGFLRNLAVLFGSRGPAESLGLSLSFCWKNLSTPLAPAMSCEALGENLA